MNAPPESETPDWNRAPTSSTTSNAQSIADRDGGRKAGEQRDAAARKREATAIALLAIHRGHVVHRLRGGEYLVTWRGVSKHCRDLADLEAHARQVGAMR